MMTKIILLGLLISFVNIHGQEIHMNNDVNSSIERLDTEDWDDTYYQYNLVNNIPFLYNKQKNNYHFNPIYVTYFLKNGRFNAYHDIHINWLYDLGKKFKSKKLLYFANKFFDYRQQWEHTDIYQQLFKNNKVILNDISQ